MNENFKVRVFYNTPFIGEKSRYYYIDKDNFDYSTDIIKEWIEDDDRGEYPIYYKYCELLFIDNENFIVEIGTTIENKSFFENDIVKSEHWNPKEYVIKFMQGKFCLCDLMTEYYMADIDMMYDSDGCNFEVIGNINENPELLEIQSKTYSNNTDVL